MWKGSRRQRSTVELLEEALRELGQVEREQPSPDLWPAVQLRLGESPVAAVAWYQRTGCQVAASVAASLAAAYLVGPWLSGPVPGLVARAFTWVGVAPAWFFSQWGGWWESLLRGVMGFGG